MIYAKLAAKKLIRWCENYPGDQRFFDALVIVASCDDSPIHFRSMRGNCRIVLANGVTHDVKMIPSELDIKADPYCQVFSGRYRRDIVECLTDWIEDLDTKPVHDVDVIEQELSGANLRLYRYFRDRVAEWISVEELIHDGVFEAGNAPDSYRKAFKRLQNVLGSHSSTISTRRKGQEACLEK